MGPSFVIEKLAFQRGSVWQVRFIRGLVTFLVGHSGAGRSTALEALLYPLGLTTATITPEVGACQQIRLTVSLATPSARSTCRQFQGYRSALGRRLVWRVCGTHA